MTFSQMFGAAQWLSAPAGADVSALFRSAFVLDSVPEKATLTIVGLGFFEAKLNGQPITDARFLPLDTDYAPREIRHRGVLFDEVTAHRLLCPQFDVTALLRPGENLLSTAVGSGWFAEPSNWSMFRFGGLRMVFSLRLEYADGAVRCVVSDGTSKTRAGWITDSHLRTGETHDRRLIPYGWEADGFDDGDWENAAVIAPLETEYLTSDCPPDRVIRTIVPILLSERDGVRMYDCGENISGSPVLRCHAAAGETVTVEVSERLAEDGTLEEKHRHGQHLTVIGDGTEGREALVFTWFGFRYFTVTGDAEVTCVEVVHTDAAVASSFDSSDETLNWTYRAYLRTQLDNMHAGIPSDCPHLERCGYTGDGELCCDAVMTMLDAQKFYKKWIGDISDCQDRLTGHVQYTAPYVRCGGGPGGWGCAIVEVPYTYYKHYGDTTPLAELYPQMLRYFDYLDAHSEGGLVVSDRAGEWCLGDWCSVEKMALPEPYVNDYFYVKSITRMLEIAPLVGRAADIPALTEKMEYLKRVMTEKYFDPATGDFCGGTQGANAFAVDIGLGDERTYRNMVQFYRARGSYDTGIFGTDIVTRLLLEKGDADVALTLLTSDAWDSSFGCMRKAGATTLLEQWNPEKSRSDNHPMFGAAVRYFFTYLLGIRQAEGSCGWRAPMIAPVIPAKLDRASGSVTTVRGEIAVAWEKADGGVRFQITLPDGMEAAFRYGGDARTLRGGVSEFVL